MIEVDNVTKIYDKDIVALDNISFKMTTSPFGIVGPNGAGKTTLINIFSNIIIEYSGNVEILGINTRNELELKRKVGFLLDRQNYSSDIKLWKYMKFIAKLRGITGTTAEKEIKWALQLVGLYEYRDKKYGILSAGMKKRFALGCSLIGHPELIIMDEPTNSLDPSWILNFENIIKDLNGTCNFFISSHSIDEMSNIWKKVVFINEGKIVQDLEIQHNQYLLVKSTNNELLIEKYNADFNNGYVVIRNPSDDIIDEINDLIIQKKIRIREMKFEKPSIRETYKTVFEDEANEN